MVHRAGRTASVKAIQLEKVGHIGVSENRNMTESPGSSSDTSPENGDQIVECLLLDSLKDSEWRTVEDL